MSFNIDTWRQAIVPNLSKSPVLWEQARASGIQTLHGFLAGLVFEPLVAALRQAQDADVWLTLGQIHPGIKHQQPLVDLLQQWQGRIATAKAVEDQLPRSVSLREALDAIFDELNLVAEAMQHLEKSNRLWFVETLWRDLGRVGEFYRTRPSLGDVLLTGSGAVALTGGVAAGAGGVAVGRDLHLHIGLVATTEQPASHQAPLPIWPPTLPWDEPYYFLSDRDQTLVEVVQILLSRNSSSTIFVSGLGGLGKTAAAIEIGRRCLAEEGFVRIVGDSAKLEKLVKNQIVQETGKAVLSFDSLLDKIARQLDRPDVRTMSSEEKRITLQRLLARERYLVIIDNLETTDNAAQIVTNLPQLLDGSRLLITSREQVDTGSLHRVHLEGLSEADSLTFLREDARRRGCNEIAQASRETLQEIHRVTEGQPLAMKLIVGQALDLDLSLVLASLCQARGRIYRFIYWDSWRQLSEPAKKLLVYLGGVPGSISLEELIDAPVVPDSDDLLDAMQQLIRLSLVNVTQGERQKRYAIHQLTRYFVNSDLPEIWREQGYA